MSTKKKIHYTEKENRERERRRKQERVIRGEKEEMLRKQSFNGEGVETNIVAETKLKSVDEEIATEKIKAWHRPKKGSVFPAKRRSVKQMIYDLLFGKNRKRNHVHSSDMVE